MKQYGFFPSFPVDVRSLWDVNGKSLDYAGKSYRAWLEAASAMQTQTIAFLNDRLVKDSAAIARLGQCKSPTEIMNVQAEYVRHAFADFVDESQKMAASFGKIASASALAAPAYERQDTSPKRPAHRHTAH